MNTISFQPMMESRPIREIAYEVLKHAIITGEIPAGERIVETDYADRLHISRTPLREALRKLERDGLVEYVLRRGVVVRAFTIADVEEIYTIRNALEMLTLPAIIEKATEEDIASLRAQLHEMDDLISVRDFDALSPVTRAFHRQLTALCGGVALVLCLVPVVLYDRHCRKTGKRTPTIIDVIKNEEEQKNV